MQREGWSHSVSNNVADAVKCVPDVVQCVPENDIYIYLVSLCLPKLVSSLNMTLQYSISFCIVTFNTLLSIWIKQTVQQIVWQLEQRTCEDFLGWRSIFLLIPWDSNNSCVEKRSFIVHQTTFLLTNMFCHFGKLSPV